MKRNIIILVSIFVCFSAFAVANKSLDPRIYDINQSRETVMSDVVLTGAGHAQKNAIPRQISKRSNAAHAVILPEIKGVIDPETVDHSDADYIMLDL